MGVVSASGLHREYAGGPGRPSIEGERLARFRGLFYTRRCVTPLEASRRALDQEVSMITLKVNGQSHQVDVPPDTPLLWVVRENLGLTGTKYGCGMALCGACTVHLDGQPMRACVTPVSAVADKAVTTIEGLSARTDHPAQRAWIELDVPQCGYCQSGQLMTVAALLAQNASPTDADIDTAMAGHICRCGTYQRIRAAIHRAAALKRGGA